MREGPSKRASSVTPFLVLELLGQAKLSTARGEEHVQRMREEYRGRRDLIVRRLREIGFGVPGYPAGGFYVFANVTPFSQDSVAFSKELLKETRVSVTPGMDFGPASNTHIRLSYTTDRDRIAEGMDRLESYLSRRATDE